MAIKEVSGHILNVGDKVKMNIPVLADGDLDGVEITKSGKNYWRYMNEHPDEIYTVVELDFNYDACPYKLSGEMSGTSWAADELIHVPEAKTRFEVLKNADEDEMTSLLYGLILEMAEDGVPTEGTIAEWLKAAPNKQRG